jgi:hypothetical protein
MRASHVRLLVGVAGTNRSGPPRLLDAPPASSRVGSNRAAVSFDVPNLPEVAAAGISKVADRAVLISGQRGGYDYSEAQSVFLIVSLAITDKGGGVLPAVRRLSDRPR